MVVLHEDIQNKECSVLYNCGCGKKYPLSYLYWSETCKKIVCPSNSCSFEEIDSYYCAFMLDNMPTQEAILYKNCSSSVFICPDCSCVLSTGNHNNMYFFVCGYCRWDSLSIHLVDDQPDTLIMNSVARERESKFEEKYQSLSAYFQGIVSSNHSFNTKSSSNRQSMMGPWKWEDAEHKLGKMKLNLLSLEEPSRLIESKLSDIDKSLPIQDPNDLNEEIIQCCNLNDVATLDQRFTCMLDQPRQKSALFPQRLLLRTKRSRRCKEALDKGFPGILVKPQINPMIGDSSMHTIASWWKKATLALNTLPQLILTTPRPRPCIVDEFNSFEIHLLIVNPLDMPIKLCLENIVVDSENYVDLLSQMNSIEIAAAEDPNLLEEIPKEHGKDDQECVIKRHRNTVTVRLQISKPQFSSEKRTEDRVAIKLLVKTIVVEEDVDDSINEENSNNTTSIVDIFLGTFKNLTIQ